MGDAGEHGGEAAVKTSPAQARGRWRRPVSIAIVVAATLALGAATTVGVAWVCVLHGQAGGGVQVRAGDGTLWTHTAWTGTHRDWHDLWWNHTLDDSRLSEAPSAALRKQFLPGWAKLPKLPPTSHPYWYTIHAGGWPLLSCYGMRVCDIDYSKLIDREAGWPQPPKEFWVCSGPLQMSGPSLLPFRPVLPGFLIETAMFGAPWAALYLLASTLSRKRRRARKGLCRFCAYDLRRDLSSGCPECGWLRQSDCWRPGARRSVKRRILVVLGYFLGGAVIACAVAALGAVFGVVRKEGTPIQPVYAGWAWERASGPACTVHVIREGGRMEDGRNPNGNATLTNSDVSPPNFGEMNTPAWAHAPSFDNWSMVEFVGAGWPARAFTATRIWKLSLPMRGGNRNWWSAAMPTSGFVLGSPAQTAWSGGFGAILPLCPVWTGLLLDAALFMLALFVVVHGVRRLIALVWPAPLWAELLVNAEPRTDAGEALTRSVPGPR